MRTLLTLTTVLAVAAVSAGAGQASPQAKTTITAAKSRYGTILFDGKGRVLYGFTRDTRGGKSQCYGSCAAAWPVYYKPGGTLKAGKGVKQKLLGTVKRKNGRLQITYNGRPLYYYVSDVRPGQITCQNVSEYGGLWLVVSPTGKLVR
jgi:predicted lipoprotein with Yx(FWY)xxD motif